LIGRKSDVFGVLKKTRPNIVAIGHDQNDIPKNIVKRYGLKVIRIEKMNKPKKFL